MDKNIITIEDMKLIVKNITEIMETEKDYLCNLDSKLGDGDIGLSMSKGFQAVNQYLKEFSKNDMGELFIKSGFIIADKAPSTIGVLVGSSFMQGGKTVKGKSALTNKDLSNLFKSMNEGIERRGKAKQGDKTILDSMIPASETFADCIEKGESLNIAIEEACKRAKSGMINTINMQSNFGRASRYLENSIGFQDPGATVGYLLYKGFNKALREL